MSTYFKTFWNSYLSPNYCQSVCRGILDAVPNGVNDQGEQLFHCVLVDVHGNELDRSPYARTVADAQYQLDQTMSSLFDYLVSVPTA